MQYSRNPSNKWISHLETEDEKEEFRKRLRISKDLFHRLKVLIEVMNKDNTKARVSLSSYDKPAWSEFQADSNGYERALTEVLNYLNFTTEE